MTVVMAPVGVIMHSQPHFATATGNNLLDVNEVCRAIDSLYQDELKPYGRIIRKRLAERARAAGCRATDLDLKHLKAACSSCAWLSVEDEDGGDWFALLRGRTSTFVDIHSREDVYPPDLWRMAESYFSGLQQPTATLPGGRYACAQVLAAQQLPFLHGRSLGQICHIVQLAISAKKMLGYLSGSIVAYCRSESKAKELCAEKQQRYASLADDGCAVATWPMVRACLRELLRSLPSECECFPLSNLKRVFRTRFQVELSETALGYAKISELLQDPRLKDLCTVQLRDQGYVVLPLPTLDTRMTKGTLNLAECLAGSSSQGGEGPSTEIPPRHARARKPLELDLDDLSPPTTPRPMMNVERSFDEKTGFGHESSCRVTPRLLPDPQSLPRLLGSSRNRSPRRHFAGRCDSGGLQFEPLKRLDADKDHEKQAQKDHKKEAVEAIAVDGSKHAVAGEASSSGDAFHPPSVRRQRRCPTAAAIMLGSLEHEEELSVRVHNTFIHVAVPPTPSDLRRPTAGVRMSQSLPRSFWFL